MLKVNNILEGLNKLNEDPKNKLGKYGKSFIYTKRSINKKDEPVSVGTLIETIVSNIKDILKNGSNLNENLIFK